MTYDAWAYANEIANKRDNQGGIFVKLKDDGDTVVGAFVGDPFTRLQHWLEDQRQYAECQGEDCPYCKSGNRASMSVSMNFFVPEEGTMKLIEGGITWFRSVVAIKEEFGFDTHVFKIKRNGVRKDPKTTYMILPTAPMSDELKERIAMTDLHDLERIARGNKAVKNTAWESEPKKASDITVAPAVAGELVAKLKQLPREKVGAFLKEFEITQVKQLRAVDEVAARAFIADLETPETQGEVDPFAV